MKPVPNAHPTPSGKRHLDTFKHRNRSVRVPVGYMAVGRVVAAHNLNGEVKVELHTDFPERFVPGALLYQGIDLVEATIERARPHKNAMLICFEGVDDRDSAEALRGHWLFVPIDEAEQLDQDTYFIHDIIGLSVRTEDGHVLGTVQDVLATGANDVYVIATPDEPPREILIPAISQVVLRVDLDQGVMLVNLLPGLLD